MPLAMTLSPSSAFAPIRNKLRKHHAEQILQQVFPRLDAFWGKNFMDAYVQSGQQNVGHCLTLAKWAAVYAKEHPTQSVQMDQNRWSGLYNGIVDFPTDIETTAVPGMAMLSRIILSCFVKQYPFQQGNGSAWFLIGHKIFTEYCSPEQKSQWATLIGYPDLEAFMAIHFLISNSTLQAPRNAYWSQQSFSGIDSNGYIKHYLECFAPHWEEFCARASQDHKDLLQRNRMDLEANDPSFFLRHPMLSHPDGRIIAWQWQLLDYAYGALPFDHIRSKMPTEAEKKQFGGDFGNAFENFVKDFTKERFPSMWDEAAITERLAIADASKRPDLAIESEQTFVFVECKTGSMPRFGFEWWEAKQLYDSYKSTVAKSLVQIATAMSKAQVKYPQKRLLGLLVTYHHSHAGKDVQALIEEVFANKPNELELVKPYAKQISVCHILEYLNLVDCGASDWDHTLDSCLAADSHFFWNSKGVDGEELRKTLQAEIRKIHVKLMNLFPAFHDRFPAESLSTL